MNSAVLYMYYTSMLYFYWSGSGTPYQCHVLRASRREPHRCPAPPSPASRAGRADAGAGTRGTWGSATCCGARDQLRLHCPPAATPARPSPACPPCRGARRRLLVRSVELLEGLRHRLRFTLTLLRLHTIVRLDVLFLSASRSPSTVLLVLVLLLLLHFRRLALRSRGEPDSCGQAVRPAASSLRPFLFRFVHSPARPPAGFFRGEGLYTRFHGLLLRLGCGSASQAQRSAPPLLFLFFISCISFAFCRVTIGCGRLRLLLLRLLASPPSPPPPAREVEALFVWTGIIGPAATGWRIGDRRRTSMRYPRELVGLCCPFENEQELPWAWEIIQPWK